MPYAKDNLLSLDPIEGGITITDEEHDLAMEGMLSGKVVSIVNKKLVLQDRVEEQKTEETPVEKTDEELLRDLIYERNSLLSDATDKLDRHRNQKDYDLPTTLTDEKVKEWAVYAQALRDFTTAYGDLRKPSWPTPPSE